MSRIINNFRIAIFVSFSGEGGVERMMVNLIEGLISLGCKVDLVLVKTQKLNLDSFPPGVNLVKLKASHTFSSLLPLIIYLRRKRPDALLAAKNRANQVAILAKILAGVSTRIAVRMGTTTSAALTGKSKLLHLAWYMPMRIIYPFADSVIAVSRGVAADISKITGLPAEGIKVIPNPTIPFKLFKLAEENIIHPWFSCGNIPVILGVGRLTRQKDFPTLIKAFAKLRLNRPCRLIILGDGNDRPLLEGLATDLGVKDDLYMPGFTDNPFAYLKRVSLFVLSSAWEGSPNALIEALALGTPVVSTDCPSGPSEILLNGRYGPLVPVGDAHALATAMHSTLDNPHKKEFLMSAVREYTVEKSSKRYLDALTG